MPRDSFPPTAQDLADARIAAASACTYSRGVDPGALLEKLTGRLATFGPLDTDALALTPGEADATIRLAHYALIDLIARRDLRLE